VDDPDRAYLPSDAAASGHVPGEGGAILVVEAGDAARRRGHDRGYGVVAGWASTFDHDRNEVNPDGLRRAILGALGDAGLVPEQVDLVVADAAGSPELDRAEAAALADVFGPGAVPVTAPKTTTGRLYSGGAPLDVAVALLSLRDQVIPPTIGTRELADGCDHLDLVTGEPREARLRVVLVLARGYGGFCSALVLRAMDDPDDRQDREETPDAADHA
jgi:minimal PKS chain-length factor (CLF/KS beta)